MSEQIIINPVTRISGFLEIQVVLENSIITDAKCSGLLFRGFEKMLKGRSPLDAIYFTQRICGICSTAHSVASSLALENALKVAPEKNDMMLRDFIHGCEFLQNHIRHFYQYTLPDFIKGPDINPLYQVSHSDFRFPDRINSELGRHYMESFQYSRLAHEMLAILGGKAPHNHGIFVGGATVSMDSANYIKVKSILKSISEFVSNIMLQDVFTIAEYYPDYYYLGKGYGDFLSYGVFDYRDKDIYYVSPGILIKNSVLPIDESKISENIYRAWYEADKEDHTPLETTVEENTKKQNAYSWVKAPRYDGLPMEVGPLARMWLSNNYKRGISAMDRTIARVLEAKKIVDIMTNIIDRIDLKPVSQKQYIIPDTAIGSGLIDTTRGALGHWISIEEKSIKNYEIITPTAWNLSPEDSYGIKGTMEQALTGTRINDIKHPVEIGRIVRSFDPCVSCATHMTSSKGDMLTIRVV